MSNAWYSPSATSIASNHSGWSSATTLRSPPELNTNMGRTIKQSSSAPPPPGGNRDGQSGRQGRRPVDGLTPTRQQYPDRSDLEPGGGARRGGLEAPRHPTPRTETGEAVLHPPQRPDRFEALLRLLVP